MTTLEKTNLRNQLFVQYAAAAISGVSQADNAILPRDARKIAEHSSIIANHMVDVTIEVFEANQRKVETEERQKVIQAEKREKEAIRDAAKPK